jgi:hypothetical protein
MSSQIYSLSTTSFMNLLEPVSVCPTQRWPNLRTAEEWWVSNHGIKAGCLIEKHLRKLDHPMERANWVDAMPQRRRQFPNLMPHRIVVTATQVLQCMQRRLPCLQLRLTEEGRQHRITQRANICHCRLDYRVLCFLHRAQHIIRRLTNCRAALHHLLHPLRHKANEQAALPIVTPGQRADLPRRQTHQAVAGLQRVVQEGELVVARQRRQPQ